MKCKQTTRGKMPTVAKPYFPVSDEMPVCKFVMVLPAHMTVNGHTFVLGENSTDKDFQYTSENYIYAMFGCNSIKHSNAFVFDVTVPEGVAVTNKHGHFWRASRVVLSNQRTVSQYIFERGAEFLLKHPNCAKYAEQKAHPDTNVLSCDSQDRE